MWVHQRSRYKAEYDAPNYWGNYQFYIEKHKPTNELRNNILVSNA